MKKLLLLAAVAAMATNTMAEETKDSILFEDNYESYTTGSKSNDVKKSNKAPYWRIESNGVTQLTVENDDTHGNYVQIMQRNSIWNAGGAYCLFYTDKVTSAGTDNDRFELATKNINQYSIEFDAALYTTLNAYMKGGSTMTWAGACMEFAVLNTTFNTGNKWRADYGLTSKGEGQNESYDNVIFLKQFEDNITTEMPAADTYKMEENVPFTLGSDETKKVTLPTDGSWNHWKITVDRESYKVVLTIGDKEIVSYTADSELVTDLILRGLYFRTGNCNTTDPSYVKIDNLKVTGKVPANTTGIQEIANTETTTQKTVKYLKDGALCIKTSKGIMNAVGIKVK